MFGGSDQYISKHVIVFSVRIYCGNNIIVGEVFVIGVKDD
jgi:hypothetical protein